MLSTNQVQQNRANLEKDLSKYWLCEDQLLAALLPSLNELALARSFMDLMGMFSQNHESKDFAFPQALYSTGFNSTGMQLAQSWAQFLPSPPQNASTPALPGCKRQGQKKAKKSDEAKADEDLFDGHPHEIIYTINKKTNRRLKRIKCTFEGCGKVFEKKWNFKDHIRMHRGDTPYKWDECGKCFTQRGNLVKHMRQHEFKNLKSRKIHKCQFCDKAFTEKYNLKVGINLIASIL